MKGKLLLGISLALVLVALAIVASQAQGPDEPDQLKPDQSQLESGESGMEPLSGLAVAETVSSTFSYQGVYKEGGQPVTGDREMVFRLYSNDVCTNPVGSPLTYTVPISNGLFSVNLAVNQADFNGQALWLETEVGGTSVGCQTIQAVPYALGLRPGAVITGTGGFGAPLKVQIGEMETDGSSAVALAHPSSAVWADTRQLGTFGVYANAEHDWATTTGVYAGSNSPGGIGVRGVSSYVTSATYGGHFESFSNEGRGVYGHAGSSSGTTYGVWGQSNSTAGTGVYAYANNSSGTTYGVWGQSDSTAGTGVHGYASSGSGTTYGVWGQSDSATGVGVYARGTDDGADLILGGNASTALGDDGRIYSDPTYAGSDIYLFSNDAVIIDLDEDDNESGDLVVRNGADGDVFRVSEAGDVSQPRTGDGLVKAAVYANCRDLTSQIARYFSTVGGSITIADGASAGRCIIDFGFDISDRFWIAAGVGDAGASCHREIADPTDQLRCFRWRGDTGAAQSGDIMVTIY